MNSPCRLRVRLNAALVHHLDLWNQHQHPLHGHALHAPTSMRVARLAFLPVQSVAV